MVNNFQTVQSELINGLLLLGETHETGFIYSIILREDPISIDRLSVLGGISVTETRSVVSRLISLSLATSDFDVEHTIVYRALPPDQAFESLLTWLKWGARKSWNNSKSAVDYPTEIKEFISEAEERCHLLIDLCLPMYRRTAVSGLKEIVVTRSKDEMISGISQYIGKAQIEIASVVSPPHLLGPFVWTSVQSRIREGVQYSRISEIQEIQRHGINITQREIDDYKVELTFIDHELIKQKFYVIDDTHVIFFKPAPESDEFELFGQIITNRELASHYKKTFIHLKKKSIPARFVLDEMRRKRDEILRAVFARMEEIEARWIESTINYGVFNRFRLEPNRERSIAERSIEYGFLSREGNRIVSNLSMTFDDLAISWKTAREENRV